MHSARYTVHSARYTVHSARYTVHSARYTVHSARYTVHTARYTVHCARYRVQCAEWWQLRCLHELRYLLNIPQYLVWFEYLPLLVLILETDLASICVPWWQHLSRHIQSRFSN